MPTRTHAVASTARANGWTQERKRLFLAMLAEHHTVTMACSRVGLSREAAYKLRRRDAEFAWQWQQAQACARRAALRAFMDSLPDRLRDVISNQQVVA